MHYSYLSYLLCFESVLRIQTLHSHLSFFESVSRIQTFHSYIADPYCLTDSTFFILITHTFHSYIVLSISRESYYPFHRTPTCYPVLPDTPAIITTVSRTSYASCVLARCAIHILVSCLRVIIALCPRNGFQFRAHF